MQWAPNLIKDFEDDSAWVEEITPCLLEAWRRMQGHNVGLHQFVGKAGDWQDLRLGIARWDPNRVARLREVP